MANHQGLMGRSVVRSSAMDRRFVVECLVFALLLYGVWYLCYTTPAIPWGGRDYAVFMQGIYRFQLGQIPHVDYYMPLGLLNFALPAWLTRWGFSDYAALLMAIGLLAWTLAMPGYFLFQKRSPLFASLLATAIFCYGFCFTPTGLDTLSFRRLFNIHLYYNHLGFSTLLLCACLLYQAFMEKRALTRLEQGVLAWCAFISFYIKLSYFLALLVLIGMWILLSERKVLRSSMPTLLLSFCFLNLLVMMVYGPRTLYHYYWDIMAASRASAAVRADTFVHSTLQRLGKLAWFNHVAGFAYSTCSLAVLGVWLWRGRRQPTSAFLKHWFLASLAAAVGIVYFTLTNSGPIEVGALSLPIFVTWFYFIVQTDEGSRYLRFALMGAASFVVAGKCLAVAGNIVAIHDPGGATFDPGGQLGRMSYLPAEIPRYVNAGKRLLKDVRPGSQVTLLVLDLSNILAPALQAESPKYVPLFFHLPVDWGPRCAASFDSLMTDVDIVMVPKMPLFPEETHSLLERYGSELNIKFTRVAESDTWLRYDRSPNWPRRTGVAVDPYYCRR